MECQGELESCSLLLRVSQWNVKRSWRVGDIPEREGTKEGWRLLVEGVSRESEALLELELQVYA